MNNEELEKLLEEEREKSKIAKKQGIFRVVIVFLALFISALVIVATNGR